MVNGSIASSALTTVNSGATLAGTGTVGTTVVNGTITGGPIGGTGTLHVNGNYTQNAGSTFQVNATPAGASSKVAIGGAGTLNGGTVVVNGPAGFYGRRTYTIMTAAPTSLNGTFAGLVDNIPGTTAVLIYDMNTNVLLQIFGGSIGTAGLTFNQSSVANVINATGGLGAFAAFAPLGGLSSPQLHTALDQLSGEVYGSTLSAGIENQALWLRTLAQHVRLANPCLCPATAAGGESGCDGNGTWRSWATPFGMAGSNMGDGNAHSFEYNSVGFAAGSDRRVGDDGNGLIGFATGYSNWGNTTNLVNSSVYSNSFNLASYARAQLGQAWLFGVTSYEYDGMNSRRPMDFLGSVANASFSGNQLGTYFESGYALNLGGLQVQPLGAAQYISAWRNGVSESGAGALDLNVAGARADSFRTQLGSRLVYPITTGAGRCILPEAGAYWIHEYAQNSREVVNQFAGGGPTFIANGANLGRDFGLFSTGFSTQMGPRMRAGMYYMNYVTPTAVAHGGMGQLQLAW